MTPGEIARFVNAEYGLKCDLSVVPMKRGGRAPSRAELAEQGPWVLPSPNMPTRETAAVYPGGCLVEGTNLSEGRGTTRPFELVGAPWLDADEAADAANALGLPGVGVSPARLQAHVSEARGKDLRRRAGARDGRGALPSLRDVPPARQGSSRPESRASSAGGRRNTSTATTCRRSTCSRARRSTAGSSEPGTRSTSGSRRFRPTSRASPPRGQRNLLYPSARRPVVLLVTGAHESGKTTVAVQLIEAFVKEGLEGRLPEAHRPRVRNRRPRQGLRSATRRRARSRRCWSRGAGARCTGARSGDFCFGPSHAHGARPDAAGSVRFLRR